MDKEMMKQQDDLKAVDPHMAMRKVYVKDLSFESPNSPWIFTGRGVQDSKPTMKLNLAHAQTSMENDEYEVVLRVTLQALLEDGSTLFMVEIAQAGIFWLPDRSEEQRNDAIRIECCRVLFPFAREAAWTLASRGGVPPVLMQDVDFEALYAQI